MQWHQIIENLIDRLLSELIELSENRANYKRH
ncbi:MAG: hypothetical protein ACJAUR_000031 [Ulvibacter sp.]|jgi:hypothetical protein